VIRPISNQPVKVALVENRIVVREGLCALLQQQPDVIVVAQAATVRGAEGFSVSFDVIVTEIELPDARPAEVIAGLRRSFPQGSILVLTDVSEPAMVQSVLSEGAHGYVLKTAATVDLLDGIRCLASRGSYL